MASLRQMKCLAGLAIALLAVGSTPLLAQPQVAVPTRPAVRPTVQPPADTLEFKTGYEANEATATPPGEITWMVFQNTSSLPGSTLWPMSVFYETPGDINDRHAEIVDDPAGGTNQVLHYWLKNAVIDAGFQTHTKGRIQTGFSAPLDNAVEIYSKQRLFIHSDMNHLNSYPPGADQWWLGMILEELWSGAPWLGDPNPSRISTLLFSYGGTLHLGMTCDERDTGTILWSDYNITFDLPVGEWLTVEMGYRMGDESTGRMVLIVTRESSGEKTVVFDVTDWTYDPAADAPGGPGPRPVTHWNPQKLYASDNVIDHIRDQGGVAQVSWDDFGFAGAWPPSWP